MYETFFLLSFLAAFVFLILSYVFKAYDDIIVMSLFSLICFVICAYNSLYYEHYTTQYTLNGSIIFPVNSIAIESSMTFALFCVGCALVSVIRFLVAINSIRNNNNKEVRY
jgi:hypothetical protein